MSFAIQPQFWWLYLGVLIGHAAIGLAFLSRLHGIGLSPRWMSRIEIATLFIPASLGLGCIALILFQPVAEWPKLGLAYAGTCCGVAYLLLPLVTIIRLRRPLPKDCVQTVEPVEVRSDTSAKMRGDGHGSWMLALPGNESLKLQVSRISIPVAGMPQNAGALRILQISDLHFTRAYDRSYFEWVTSVAAGFEADLVVFTGDLLDDPETLDWTLPVLGGLQGRFGQYAILGNHDVIHRPARVRKALRSAGFTMIDGRWMTIRDDEFTLALGGTSAPWGPDLDLDARPEADATVVLSHSPDLFPALARDGQIDVVLSGHTHGGQIRVPLFGPLVMPCVTGRRYDRGLFASGRTVMHVTQGVGGKHPIRYLCPPEICYLTLVPATVGHRNASRALLETPSR